MVHFGKEKVIRNLLPFCIKTISARNGQFFLFYQQDINIQNMSRDLFLQNNSLTVNHSQPFRPDSYKEKPYKYINGSIYIHHMQSRHPIFNFLFV